MVPPRPWKKASCTSARGQARQPLLGAMQAPVLARIPPSLLLSL